MGAIHISTYPYIRISVYLFVYICGYPYICMLEYFRILLAEVKTGGHDHEWSFNC